MTALNLSDSRKIDCSTRFGTFIPNILQAGCHLKEAVTVDVRAAQYSLLTLPNSDEWFERKIERIGALRLRIYFIVDLHMAQGVRFIVHESHAVRVSVEVTIPFTALPGGPRYRLKSCLRIWLVKISCQKANDCSFLQRVHLILLEALQICWLHYIQHLFD
jgi:hypothetical protein